jgi:1,2-diacylglycerol 3-beta-glucosyltransferase
MIWVTLILLVFQLYLAFLVGYLLLLTAASFKAPRSPAALTPVAYPRFMILIPAHNEEHLLPELLASLAGLDYPLAQLSVHVVADNCIDQTAAAAALGGARVHVRNDGEHLGKGYALNWLLGRLGQAGEPYDALVYLDADSVVSSNFLQVLAAHLMRGERVIQVYYAARNPGGSWAGSLRYAALAVLHFLRSQGRMALGTSVGLKGNGMVFTADVMERYSWSSSLTEDIELHMALLLNGERVTFAPDAVVWGEMPDNLSGSASQHRRWEQGRKRMARTYLPKLLAAAWRELRMGRPRRAFLLLDGVMEFLEPPFSILAVASGISLFASLAFFMGELGSSPRQSAVNPGGMAALNVLLAVGLLIGQGVYLLAGLRAVSAPKQVYLNLLYAPRLILWKSWQMIQVLFTRGQSSWVRTKRNEG